jgi:hypothetical protein
MPVLAPVMRTAFWPFAAGASAIAVRTANKSVSTKQIAAFMQELQLRSGSGSHRMDRSQLV